MAVGKSSNGSSRNRIIVALLTILMAGVFMVPPCAAEVRKRPKKHFLSWESTNANERARPWRQVTRPEREFNVKKRKTVRLKKPSLFNRRPVQFSTPAVEGDYLFVGNNAARFYGIDIKGNNKKMWSVETEGGIESPAVADDAKVYVGDTKGYVYALDVSNGETVWKTALDNEILGAPLLVGNTVYLVTLSGRLFALDRSTGIERWHTDSMERQVGFTVRRQSTPIYYDGTIIFGTSRGTLVSYYEGGSIAWVRMLGDPQAQVMDVDSRPLLVADRLYATSADGSLNCLDPDTGDIIWTTEAGGPNDVIFNDGVLYATGKGKIYAVEPDSGTVVWEQDLETAEISSPASGEDFIAVVDTEAKLYVVDSKNGDIVYDRFIRKGSYGDPIVTGDRLYVLSNSSRLFSFEIHEKKPRDEK
jgi:outer membrane protein assembly factor BamB